MEKTDILSLSLEELIIALDALGEKKFRAEQIFSWLHVKKVTEFEEMTNISLELRTKLSENFYIKRLNIAKRLESCTDNTIKYLYELDDGNHIETVLMEYKHSGRHVDSLVLMGIGEPLDNYDNVIKFLELLSSPKGRNMSLRHVSLSTCGVVPKIRELAKLRTGLTLSVSLHAADDKSRSEIMPVNNAWQISELLGACRDYIRDTGRRISFEYAVISGVNDSSEDARRLAALLRGINCHINLIPVNKIKERSYTADRQCVAVFAKRLTDLGMNVTVRRTLGADINAACGQLRREYEI